MKGREERDMEGRRGSRRTRVGSSMREDEGEGEDGRKGEGGELPEVSPGEVLHQDSTLCTAKDHLQGVCQGGGALQVS